jgi:hypothetical protein
MSVDNSEVVDGAGISKETGEVVLTISDHLNWDDEQSHIELIEQKIGRYIQFVESGQLLEAIPTAKDRAIHIRLFLQFSPPNSASKLLLAATAQLAERSLQFSFGPLPDAY